MDSLVDVLVIGAGAAGSAAALQLGRVRRSVVVVDSGEPRNAPATHMHGYLGHDGRPPGEFLDMAHAELSTYGLAVTSGRVSQVSEVEGYLRCTLDSGASYLARAVVLASGLTDILPDIDGVREMWGDRVIHCPWCHGWEVQDRRVAVIDTTGMGHHQALVFAQLTDDVVLIRNHEPALTPEETERLRLGGVNVELRSAVAVRDQLDRKGSEAMSVVLDDGDEREVDVVVVAPRFEPNASMVESLVTIGEHPAGLGRHVEADGSGLTSHPRIFAVGNVADPMQQVLHAAAHGSKAATVLNAVLTEDAIESARQVGMARAEWDSRYSENEGAMWSGEPNGSLVAETSDLVSGRALDIGCGEGADAIWLAQRGWKVTATDVSEVAIERARTAAHERDVQVDFAVEDIVLNPPPAQAFDLVVLSYPALKRASALAAVPTILNSVAIGGNLLVIGHAHDEAGAQFARDNGFDPADYLAIDDFRDALPAGFGLEVDEERARPNPPADARHRTDRVFRARRTKI